MMSTTTKRKIATSHKARGQQSTVRRNTESSPAEEIQQLRQQIMHLRSTITEQETSIEFLRDLLSQRWFDVE